MTRVLAVQFLSLLCTRFDNGTQTTTISHLPITHVIRNFRTEAAVGTMGPKNEPDQNRIRALYADAKLDTLICEVDETCVHFEPEACKIRVVLSAHKIMPQFFGM